MTLDQIVDLPKYVRKLDGGDPALLLDAHRLAHRARYIREMIEALRYDADTTLLLDAHRLAHRACCIREMVKELQYDADTFRMRLDQEFTDEELEEAGL